MQEHIHTHTHRYTKHTHTHIHTKREEYCRVKDWMQSFVKEFLKFGVRIQFANK